MNTINREGWRDENPRPRPPHLSSGALIFHLPPVFGIGAPVDDSLPVTYATPVVEARIRCSGKEIRSSPIATSSPSTGHPLTSGVTPGEFTTILTRPTSTSISPPAPSSSNTIHLLLYISFHVHLHQNTAYHLHPSRIHPLPRSSLTTLHHRSSSAFISAGISFKYTPALRLPYQCLDCRVQNSIVGHISYQQMPTTHRQPHRLITPTPASTAAPPEPSSPCIHQRTTVISIHMTAPYLYASVLHLPQPQAALVVSLYTTASINRESLLHPRRQ